MSVQELHSYRLSSNEEPTDEMLHAILANEWGAESLYINPDNIAQQEFGDWNDSDAILKAAKRATEIRYQCLAEKRKIILE